MKTGLAVALGGLAVVLAGCTGLTPADRAPRGDPVARLSPSGPAPWREDFGDPVLADLLRQADAGALDTKVALARLEQADAEVEAARALRGINAVAGVETAVGGRNFRSARSAATPTLEITDEVDVWGRFSSARRAARLAGQAATLDVASARLLVGAETVRAYLALAGAQQAEARAERRQRLAEQALELVQTRLSQGVASPPDLAARRAGVRAAAELVQRARDEATLQAARLRDLTGGRATLALSATAPSPGPPAAALPSTVVDTRPDVRAAQARLAAADQRRASAIAATRPQFQIAAALGAPDATLATLLDVRALAWAAAASASQQILDGGARRARVHAATAEADLADLAYRQTVLNAWSEVREAVVAEAQARRGLAATEADISAARAALDIGQTRHAAGVVDGLGLIALRDALEQATAAQARARLQLAEAHVQLTLATGGA